MKDLPPAEISQIFHDKFPVELVQVGICRALLRATRGQTESPDPILIHTCFFFYVTQLGCENYGNFPYSWEADGAHARKISAREGDGLADCQSISECRSTISTQPHKRNKAQVEN